jgi:hypothetical protein
MKRKDFVTETVEIFRWLETEFGYNKEVSPYYFQGYTIHYAEKITYRKDGVTITLVCDDREDMLSFEIFVATEDRNLSIQEPKRLGNFYESYYVTTSPLGMEYKSVFDYTQNTFDRKQFMRLKNNAELQLKKRDGKKRYVEVFSQLIKVALPAIEAATNPPTT